MTDRVIEEPDYIKGPREAAARVQKLLDMPDAESNELRSVEDFDPWNLFPCLYGSYSSEFDRMAVEVLEDILAKRVTRADLAAEMFREMLCTADLCDYGTSPRVCFPSREFEKVLPELIRRWAAYADMQWFGCGWRT